MRQVPEVSWAVTLRRAFRFVDNPIPVIDDAMKRYGPSYYTRLIGGRRILMTSEPPVIAHILQNNHCNYAKSPLQTDAVGQYIGQGLLTTNGDYWLRQRRLIQPGFHKKKLSTLVDRMKGEICNFYDDVSQGLTPDVPVDISKTMMDLTMRVISRSLFSSGLDETVRLELATKINEIQADIVREVRMPLARPWRRLAGKTARTLRSAARVREILGHLIRERRAQEEPYDDLLDMLLRARYVDDGGMMTDRQLIDEILILFVAGFETTATTLAWTIEMLRKHPDILKGVSETLLKDEQYDSLTELMKPSYLTQVIRETMRHYPPAWIIDRVALSDDLAQEIQIRKGDLVGLYVHGTHHDKDIWVDPQTFDPDHFHPDLEAVRPKFSFVPFGGGPRMCIGYQFAMMEMKIAISEFVLRYDLPDKTGESPQKKAYVTLKPSHPIKMHLVVKRK